MNTGLWLRRRCYLPVVPHRSRRTLRFSLVTEKPNWYLNRFGIHEHASHEVIAARNLDLLFVPLVGFDVQGNRLGMGGGFYDTTLAYLRRRCHWRKPRIVGVGFECQKVEGLPHDPWDFRLDAVLTERHLYRFTAPACA
jgi:5-formyltetrahydrofolate cyclo-ligase